MRIVPTFSAVVDERGDLRVQEREQRGFRRYLQTLKSEDVIVSIAKKGRQRSAAQNAWLWGVALPLIAEHCGYDDHEHERLHYDLLAIRFGTKAVCPLLDGAPPRIVPVTTSSELTTIGMSQYMDWLVRYAAETFGVRIPLPDEAAGVIE